MTETEFNADVDGVLLSIEDSLEAIDLDIDVEYQEGILEINFANNSKIIVNRQTALKQIWLAAQAGGFHFALKNGVWCGTRDDRELFAVLSECASQQAGKKIIIGK